MFLFSPSYTGVHTHINSIHTLAHAVIMNKHKHTHAHVYIKPYVLSIIYCVPNWTLHSRVNNYTSEHNDSSFIHSVYLVTEIHLVYAVGVVTSTVDAEKLGTHLGFQRINLKLRDVFTGNGGSVRMHTHTHRDIHYRHTYQTHTDIHYRHTYQTHAHTHTHTHTHTDISTIDIPTKHMHTHTHTDIHYRHTYQTHAHTHRYPL